jgi:hypothetical protein
LVALSVKHEVGSHPPAFKLLDRHRWCDCRVGMEETLARHVTRADPRTIAEAGGDAYDVQTSPTF